MAVLKKKYFIKPDKEVMFKKITRTEIKHQLKKKKSNRMTFKKNLEVFPVFLREVKISVMTN